MTGQPNDLGIPSDPDNILELTGDRWWPDPEGAGDAALKVRNQLSLLYGYADILEGLSPQRQSQVLKVMASKTREMVEVLSPFVDDGAQVRQPIAEYRRVRDRTRRLIVEYRLLLNRLHDTVSASAEPATDRRRAGLDLVSGED
jgi:hypothetical protein